jgi:hypothetical protein
MAKYPLGTAGAWAKAFAFAGAVHGAFRYWDAPRDERNVQILIQVGLFAVAGVLLWFLVDLIFRGSRALLATGASATSSLQSAANRLTLEGKLDEIERLYALGKISDTERALRRSKILQS